MKIGDIAILTLVMVIGLLFLSPGKKTAGVMRSDYSISEVGDIMTLKVGLASSMGYMRNFQEA